MDSAAAPASVALRRNRRSVLSIYSNLRNHACGISEARLLQAQLVEHGEVHVGERRALGQHQVLAALDRAHAMADQHGRKWEIVLPVAVRHVRAIERSDEHTSELK